MNEWLVEGNIIIRVGGAVFLVLFCINGITWLACQKMGRIPLGDFILIGIFFVCIFFNQQKVRNFAELIPDCLGVAVMEVNQKIDSMGRDINRFRKMVKDATSTMNSFYSGEMQKELIKRTTVTLPPIE